MKNLVVQIFIPSKDIQNITVLMLSISCTLRDEESIKHWIESHPNDPRFIMSMIQRNIPKDIIALHHEELDILRKDIARCTKTVAIFCEGNCNTSSTCDTCLLSKIIKKEKMRDKFIKSISLN